MIMFAAATAVLLRLTCRKPSIEGDSIEEAVHAPSGFDSIVDEKPGMKFETMNVCRFQS